MNASALVVLRCCGSDVPAFAAALAVAMRVARPHRHVIVEVAEGDVMWRPPAHAPSVAVRLVLVCGERLDGSRLQLPETTRPVHLTAVVVAPDGRDPAQPVQAVALPRVFADVVGVKGAAAMLHGLLDGEEREEGRDTDEWLAPDDDGFGGAGFDAGTVPPWPSAPEGASGLEEFRGAVPAPPPGPTVPVTAPAATVILSAPLAPAPSTPPAASAPPPVPAAPAATPVSVTPRSAPESQTPPLPGSTGKAPASATTSEGASPAAKVKKGLKRLAGAVEGLAASVVNDWILRAPADGPEPAEEDAAPAAAPASAIASGDRAPVALGASAPRTAPPGGTFTARFIAHVPGRERAVAARLADPSADARVHLHLKPCQWAPGTAVTVALAARGLRVEPPSRTFTWQGDEHVEEFHVTVPADAPLGTVVLTFDAAIDGFVVATLRIDLVVTSDAGARKARTSATATAARTAFASYAAVDRARVLDRVASVQLNAGLDVFVDGLSVQPGETRRARLTSEIRGRDMFLLFWSGSAASSSEVAWEYRTAIETRGVQIVQLHPLEPDVPLPAPLADSPASDPPMGTRTATAPRAGA